VRKVSGTRADRAKTSPACVVLILAAVGCAHPALLPQKAIALNHEGASALESGNLELAEARIALALEYNPRFTEAWVNLGLVEMTRGQMERARRDFVRARELNPDLPAPQHALGLFSEAEGHPDEAERRYRAALRIDPGFAPARANLGRILFDRGSFDESREQFLRLTQIAPERSEGWVGLGESLLRLRRPRDVGDIVVRARRYVGVEVDLGILEARALLQEGEFEEAERRLQPFVESSDTNAASRASAWLAVARLSRGNLAGAETAAYRAVSLDPDERVAHYAVEVVRAARSPQSP
jgi:tetratricopeptide (TPR) repeat protein